MERLLRSRLGSNLTLIAASAAVPAAAMHFLVSENRAPVTATQHLFIMAIGSTIAALASGTLMWAGFRRRETRAVVAGGAFAAMTLILAIHGLATPGVIIGPNGVVAVAGGLALPIGGAILTVAALPSLRGPRHLRTVAVALVAVLGLIAALGIAGFAYPADVPAVPGYGSSAAVVLLVVGALFFAIVASRAVRTFALTRRTGDLVVVVGIVWLGMALVPVLVLDPFTWVWWTGHALELLGVTLVGVPVAMDVHRGRPSHPLVGDLPAAELVAEEEAFLGARVRVLMTRLETKDRSTEEHTRRVAEWAVAIGEALGLSAGRLHDLALGGLLHDIGKLSIPDAILGKPGALTDAEMAVIRCHPVLGDDLLVELGYPDQIRRVVRGHHERLDGTGYPDGLSGDELDLDTRILAVADVWDALVSPRVYRGAWTRERAMALLVEESGTAFDARCVDALRTLTGVVPAAPAAPLADAA
ncbi:MAG TPA: HD domain-containing phosphohydrolase [Baekduia sp.]|uniref:HD-GYP domain-containing protein n=1 Tax=Baekduia sp. TaxID=2600305 RepID=UPI002BA8D747|nr:HD domain-containing phosphohydrolase [Baekduia sp.]HMJ34396.1 HD domain-containing phosphohydrolase [Baekduia sp.]